ncbi:MAG: SDR family NAD(P)-dependent oxidoreductase [Bacteroidetes bacterium]|nr:SDR family NAD(P)-dependent oxidoreductase [Bacteroidota bacterium]
MKLKIVLITGATSGIGKATALLLAQNGHKLILCGRRKSRLDDLSEEIRKSYSTAVHTLNMDVRNKDEVFAAIDSLPDAFKPIDVLINNAGLASGLSTVDEGVLDDWEKMIDTNLKGLLYMSRAVLPLMPKNGDGHIINLGSIAGKEAYINGNVYCATKAAVDNLTRGMRIDLAKFPIRVSAIHPGAVETEFSIVRFKGDEERAKKVYDGFENLLANDCAEAIWFILNRPNHVNINELTIMPTAQPNATTILRK